MEVAGRSHNGAHPVLVWDDGVVKLRRHVLW